MRISDWSSDVCSSDLLLVERNIYDARIGHWSSPLRGLRGKDQRQKTIHNLCPIYPQACRQRRGACLLSPWRNAPMIGHGREYKTDYPAGRGGKKPASQYRGRSEEHTSELQSLMRISYAVFCLHKKHKRK